MDSTAAHIDRMERHRHYSAWQYALCWLLVLAAVGEFYVRGPLYRPATMWDFAVIYSAAKVWGDGGNPYDNAQVAHAWAAGGGIHTVTNDLSWLPSLVLPSVLTVIWPMTLLGPVAASWVWIAASILLLALTVWAMLRLAGIRAAMPPALCMIALVLAFAPIHVGLLTGQPALWCAAFVVLAAWLEHGGGAAGSIAGGILLGLATALKPQLGGPFIAYFLLRRRWSTAIWAVAIFAAACVIALWRLQITGGPWIASWHANFIHANGVGQSNDFDFANPHRDHLMQLQLLLLAITHNRAWTNVLTWLFCAAAGIAYAILLLRLGRGRLSTRVTLLSLAPLAALTLLPAYHRYYDAAILLLPLAWVFAEPNRRVALATLLLLLPFLMPLALWTNLVNYHYLPLSLTHLAVWNLLVIPYQVWAILGLLGVLLVALRRETEMQG